MSGLFNFFFVGVFCFLSIFFLLHVSSNVTAQVPLTCMSRAISEGYASGACYAPQPPINATGCEGSDIDIGVCPEMSGDERMRCCARPQGSSPPPPRYDIRGTVFIDNDRNGTNEGRFEGATMSLSGSSGGTSTTNNNGFYSFFNRLGGGRRYTVTLAVPTGYQTLSSDSVATTLGPNRTINFRIARLYTISGNVFNDINKNRLKDADESNYQGQITMSTTGGVITVNAGSFTIANLPAGTYTVSYTSPMPSGYQLVYPFNGPPPSFRVTVGPSCIVDVATGASCTSGDIINLNFAITNSIPWIQIYGLDARLDHGFTSSIPSSPTYPPYASVKGD